MFWINSHKKIFIKGVDIVFIYLLTHYLVKKMNITADKFGIFTPDTSGWSLNGQLSLNFVFDFVDVMEIT